MAEPGGAVAAQKTPWWDLSPVRQDRLAMALVLLMTVPLLTKIFTSDVGTHIALGRQIVETRSIPDKEFLNYPSLGIGIYNPTWLFHVVLALHFWTRLLS